MLLGVTSDQGPYECWVELLRPPHLLIDGALQNDLSLDRPCGQYSLDCLKEPLPDPLAAISARGLSQFPSRWPLRHAAPRLPASTGFYPTTPPEAQAFRMPGQANRSAEDDQGDARGEGQGNGDQSRDDQDGSRHDPCRLDDAEHAFKKNAFRSGATQLSPFCRPSRF